METALVRWRQILAVAAVVWAMATAHAEIPQVISYQGKVTDTSGSPVADGNYTMRFRIYNAVTAGTMQWDSGARTVTVAGGIFSVLLGESPQPAIGLDFDADYWLLVTFSGDDQSPRRRMTSVGYAYMASGLIAGTEVSGSVTSGTTAAVKGRNTAASGVNYGLYGETLSNAGFGVYGVAASSTGAPVGVFGESGAPSGAGVLGFNGATSGAAYGVCGRTSSSDGSGVYGEADASTGAPVGVYGQSGSTVGTGVKGLVTATDGMTFGVYGESTSQSGRGIWGLASATAGITYGGRFDTYSTAGTAVYGRSAATTGDSYGGRFESASIDGRGVDGWATAPTGETYGVRGGCYSTSGRGVYGLAAATSGETFGIYGRSASTSGTGVFGMADATTGYTYGGRFESASTHGAGVSGKATTTDGYGIGVYGRGDSSLGIGVYGMASAIEGQNYGVQGVSNSTYGTGVFGFATATTGQAYGVNAVSYSSSGRGVYGRAIATAGENQGGWFESGSTSGTGVYGWSYATSGTTYGGRFDSFSSDGTGVRGSGGFCGLYGYSLTGDGVRSFTDATNKSGIYGVNNLTSGAAYGVYGRAYSPAGYAVYYSGNLAGTGTKSCVVKTSKGPTLLYCQESPENWFEDFGEGQLVNGRCHIELDGVFLETVTIDEANPMKVFVEFDDENCAGTAVKRGATGFDLVERLGGTSSCSFWYRVVGKRKGFEARRLDVCEAAQSDSYLYPELREKELQEIEDRRVRMASERARFEASRSRIDQEPPLTQSNLEDPATSNRPLGRRPPISLGSERGGL